MKARFAVTVSRPINNRLPGSVHVKDKAMANSAIALVRRLRRRHLGHGVKVLSRPAGTKLRW